MTLGEKIEFFANEKEINIHKLSLQAGISYTHLRRIIQDKSAPKFSTVDKICNVLHISLDKLSEYNDKEK